MYFEPVIQIWPYQKSTNNKFALTNSVPSALEGLLADKDNMNNEVYKFVQRGDLNNDSMISNSEFYVSKMSSSCTQNHYTNSRCNLLKV